MNQMLSTLRIQMKNSLARPMFRFTIFASPILYTCITYYMFKQSNIANFAVYVILGSSLLSLWSSIVFSSAGDIDRERYMGTLSILYASPTSFQRIVFAKICGNTLLAILPFEISFLLMKFVFQESIRIQHGIWFTIVFILTLVSFIALAYVFSAFFTMSRKASILMNCLEYPVFLCCGIVFPITQLPHIVHPISYILSPTWASALLRQSVLEISDISMFYIQLLILVGMSIGYFIVGYIMFMYIDKKVRIQGTLGVM